MSCSSFFLLWTGITLDFFCIYGKVPVLTQLLNTIDKGFNNADSHFFIILMEISSWTCDLLMFKALIILMVSLTLKTNEESVSLVTKIGRLKSLPSLRRGGITGIFQPLKMF